MAERCSPGGVVTAPHSRHAAQLDQTTVRNDKSALAVTNPVSDRRPQLPLPFGQSTDGPTSSNNLCIADEGLRPRPVCVVTELGLGAPPSVAAHVHGVVDCEAHRDGRLDGPGDVAGDNKAERAGLLANPACEGNAPG